MTITKTVLFLFLSTLILAGCKSSNEEETFAQKTEKQHHKEAFLSKEAVQFDLKLEFGGKERIDATFTLLTNSTKGLIEFKNGSKIIYNKDKVYYTADIPSEKSVRFDAYTWAYFFLFPYKLSDPGTIWNPYDNKESDAAKFDAEKLSFKSGTGDAPDDWYVVYANKETLLIEKAAYIVTFMGNKEEAEKNPHAIQYTDYREIDGIPIATKWIFWEWKEGKGLTNEIGKADLSNIKFVTLKDDIFKTDSNFKTN